MTSSLSPGQSLPHVIIIRSSLMYEQPAYSIVTPIRLPLPATPQPGSQ